MDVRSERIKAIITIVVTAAVNIANIYGWAIDVDTTLSAVLTIASAVTIAYSWWKNQNLTTAAVEGQAVTNALKAGE